MKKLVISFVAIVIGLIPILWNASQSTGYEVSDPAWLVAIVASAIGALVMLVPIALALALAVFLLIRNRKKSQFLYIFLLAFLFVVYVSVFVGGY